MKRRITSMLLAAAMTITMLTGCGSQGKETEKTDTGAIVLDMYHSWSTDSERGAALDKLIQEFNKEYEGKIEVKVTINPDFPAYQEKVKTMISTDTTPDIFHYNFNPNDLSRQKSGKLMDFSEYMDDEWRARFGEGDLENLTIDGEITSIPFEKAGAVFYYNKEVFERLESKKSKIEEIFGDKLDWYSSREGSEAKRIIYKREADVFNPSKQEEYFAWMIDKCDELSNALVQVGEMDEEPQEKDKFSKLKQYLENCGKTELTLTFADIEAIIGCTLCKSAYNYSAYWNPSPTHTMPNTILAAGFKVVSVDLVSKSLLLQK